MARVAEAIGLYSVRLLPGDRVFTVDPAEDVLTAGLRQGVDLRQPVTAALKMDTGEAYRSRARRLAGRRTRLF